MEKPEPRRLWWIPAALSVLIVIGSTMVWQSRGAHDARVTHIAGTSQQSRAGVTSVNVDGSADRLVDDGNGGVVVIGHDDAGQSWLARGAALADKVPLSSDVNPLTTTTTPVAVADGLVWFGQGQTAIAVDPTTGRVIRRWTPPAGDGTGNSHLEGDWISGLTAYRETIYVVRNADASVMSMNLASGRVLRHPVDPQYAGASSLAVDTDGNIFVAGSERQLEHVLVLSSDGVPQGAITSTASRVSVDAQGLVWLPAPGACSAYRGMRLVRTVTLAGRTPTACLSAGSTTLGWSVESGGYGVRTPAGITEIDPFVTPITVFGPTGAKVESKVVEVPTDVLLTSTGTLWVIGYDGSKVMTSM